jgi:hypothetical protein
MKNIQKKIKSCYVFGGSFNTFMNYKAIQNTKKN